ncbi:cupredoxin family protein [Achromobacter aegrifaciens]|uniref:cupredoxin domain-containing protein n=1 Tax=Achromobacter aegrifaciens TaxID=1287736 RepID=UPI0027BA5F2E|nr:cupredoxin family protein [Achromobacter aegrifaciens]WLW62588.1 cupredoxin family protein [Achromobacter aegrifaciens]
MKKLVKLAQGAVAAGALLLSFGAMAAPGHGAGHGGGHEAAAPIGKPGNPAKVSRTIVVDMTDAMRFTPDEIDVKAGETIRFKVSNSGKIRHEMVLGTTADLNSHYQMMLKDPGMRHEEPNSVSLEAGKAGDIVWTFDKAGTVAFACLEPGHYPAGMKGAVSVK